MFENILRVEIQLKPYKLKNGKTKEIEENQLPRLCLGRNGHDR